MSIGIVQVPASFETLRDAVGPERIGHVLIEAPDDLLAIKAAVAEVGSAGQSKLLFLLGDAGQGKTSLVESTAVFLADVVGTVVTPPPDFLVPLHQLPAWINDSLEAARRTAGDRLVVFNLDKREIPVVDEAATQAAMGNLNALLRNTPNTLLIWPVNKPDFANAAIDRLHSAGGQTALTRTPIHKLRGLATEHYSDALRLILDATSVTLDDAAISWDEIETIAGKHQGNVGEFLRAVQGLVVSRYDLGELGATLPVLNIIFSSNDDTYSAARLLRRGDRFLVDPDKLLQYSRANVATDWKRRGAENPRKGLPFIASLFQTRLLNLSSSAVVNACAFCDDEDLQAIVRSKYRKPVKANAANSMRNSPLARALRGEADVGLARANPTQPIKEAFTAIQKKTNPKHRQINTAICNVLETQLDIPLPGISYEHRPFSDDRELRIDASTSRQGVLGHWNLHTVETMTPPLP